MRHLRETEGQLTLARAKIADLTKELEQKVEEMTKVKQTAYDFGAKRNGSISKVSDPNYVSRLISSNLDRSSKCYCHGFHLGAKEP